MAITDKKKGVWGLDQVYNKENQGSIWTYSGASLLHFWNYNSNGRFGLNYVGSPSNPSSLSGNRASSPIQIPDSSDWKFFKSKIGDPWVVKTDGTLWSWGSNSYGNLGHNQGPGQLTGYSSPAQIGSGTDWDEAYSAVFAGCAIKTDGTLWICGRNNKGVLGLNQAHDAKVSSPTQLPGTTWKQLATHSHTAAVKTDGTLWSWGLNQHGQIGANLPENTNYSSPVQIPGTDWASVSVAGGHYSLATRTDGTLWGWGSNTYGMLGQNSRTWYSSPVQIPGTTWPIDASQYHANDFASWAVKTDGTLWGWGINNQGVLGQNQAQPALYATSSPVQIPGTTWSRVSGSGDNNNISATKTDNTLWQWGFGGANCYNSNASYSSPIQISGSWDHRYLNGGSVRAGIQIK